MLVIVPLPEVCVSWLRSALVGPFTQRNEALPNPPLEGTLNFRQGDRVFTRLHGSRGRTPDWVAGQAVCALGEENR